MDMTTTWGVSDMVRYQSSGLVYEVNYTVTSTLEDFTYTDYGTVNVSGNPSSPDFIPYNDLTENTVIGWVQDVLGSSGVASIENDHSIVLQDMINTAQNPSTDGVPW